MEFGVLSGLHATSVKPYTDLIEGLRKQGIHSDVHLPQIAVLGEQGSGKSSVLEAISGVPFPRGDGSTTRCAVKLVMRGAPSHAKWKCVASLAGEAGSEREVDGPGALAGEIARLAAALTEARGLAFSGETIVLELSAPDAPDMTLVDLPGLVRDEAVPPEEVDAVNGTIANYLVQEQTIILACLACDGDAHGWADVLGRARKIDPKGARTIGVLTKPDLIAAGAEDDVLSTLQNHRMPLRLGYVMVRCRPPAELAAGSSVSAALKEETKFFLANEPWNKIATLVLGAEKLTKRLVSVLVSRIQNALPGMKWQLQNQLALAAEDLKPLGAALPSSDADRKNILLQVGKATPTRPWLARSLARILRR